MEPSPDLRALEAKVLRHDDSLGMTAPDDEPVTRFASGPGGRLAYQVVGDGPIDLVLIPGVGGNLEIRWEEPDLSRFFRRLARSVRLVLLDKRGTGLSDRDARTPTPWEETDDVLAVMDAVGASRAVLLGVLDGGATGLLTAAVHPERVRAVVTYAAFAAWDLVGEPASATIDAICADPDRGPLVEDVVPTIAPSRVDDASFTRWLGRYLRMAVGAGGAAARLDRLRQIDVGAALPKVSAPVLALHRHGDRWIPPDNARHIAENVQRGRYDMVDGNDNILWAGDVDLLAQRIEQFLVPHRGGLSCERPVCAARQPPSRILLPEHPP